MYDRKEKVHLNSKEDLQKLKNLLRISAAGNIYVSQQMYELTLQFLTDYARENGISVKRITPNGNRTIACTCMALGLGGSFGAMFGFWGMIVLGIAGALAGNALSHYTVTIHDKDDGSAVLIL